MFSVCNALPRASRLAMAVGLALSPAAVTLAATTHADGAAATPATAPSVGDTQPVIATLETVQVQGTREDALRAEQSQVPGGVYLLDAHKFRQRAVNNLADALRYVPGVMAESNSGGDDMVLSIRGSNLNSLAYDNAGVALFQDGLPVTAADGNNHNRMLDPRMASDVIVANGINALTYGASTLGGAIDFISRTARNSDPREVFASGGSHGQAEAGASAGRVSGDFDGMVTVDARHFGGYRDHSRQDSTSVHANGGWQVSDAFRVRMFASHIDNRQQLPGALTLAQYAADPWQAEPSYALGNHQLNARTDRVAAKATWDIDAGSRLEFGVSWEDQRLFHPIVDVFIPAGPGPNPPLIDVFSLLVNTRQRTGGGMLRYRLRAGNHSVIAGINLAHTTNRGGNYANDAGRRGTLQDIVDKRADNATVFAVDRWTFAPSWMLVYGAQGTLTRLDDQQVDGAGSGNTTPRDHRNRFSSFNPRIGVIRTLGSDGETYASVGRLYQPPNTFELDNARRERGAGADLEAMHGLSYEIGLRGATPVVADAASWRWNVSAYHEAIRNEIFSVDNPDVPGISLTANLPRTDHTGLEALLGASFPTGAAGTRIEPLLSATWNDFTFHHDPTYGNNRLPSAPRFAVHAEMMVRRANGFYAGPTVDWVGSRYADFANSLRVGGYAVAGVRVGIERGGWEMFAEARNLFDRRYAATVQVVNRATANDALLNPGAPRSLYVGVCFKD